MRFSSDRGTFMSLDCDPRTLRPTETSEPGTVTSCCGSTTTFLQPPDGSCTSNSMVTDSAIRGSRSETCLEIFGATPGALISWAEPRDQRPPFFEGEAKPLSKNWTS